jgi:hypothetical protein
MSEVLVKFTATVRGRDGKLYWPQACGRVADDGLWEGWIEFSSEDGGALRTGRETQQPRRGDLVYWAEGLSDAYLEGALDRALRLESGPPIAGVVVSAEPRFDRPAADRPVNVVATVEPSAVLDPFAVYMEGEDILRRQLGALSRDQVRNIALAYHLADDSPLSVVQDGSGMEIAEQIVRGVKSSLRARKGVEGGTTPTANE